MVSSLHDVLKRAVLGLFLTALSFSPARADFPCDKKEIVLKFYIGLGYIPALDGAIPEGHILTLVNARNGEFVVIGIDGKGTACTLIQGANLQLYLERSA